MEFILRFTFTNPDLDTTIVGTANPAHLKANVDILLQGPLPMSSTLKRSAVSLLRAPRPKRIPLIYRRASRCAPALRGEVPHVT